MKRIAAAPVLFALIGSASTLHSQHTGKPQSELDLGAAYVRAGRCESAIEPLQRALPDEKARFLLGSCYFQAGRWDLAAAELEALRARPAFAENALYLLEETYRKLHDEARARQAFTELLTRYPDSALIHKLLGAAYDAQGRYPEALREFETAAAKDPDLPEVNFAAGLISLKLHNEAAAQPRFERELSLNGCFVPALFYLGEMKRKANALPSAAEWYRRALRCQPGNADAHLGLGVTLQNLGRDAEALREFREAARLAPDRPDAHFQLARALARAGAAAESNRELQKARQLQEAQDASARERANLQPR